MAAALLGLVLLSTGLVWLADGGAARWPGFLTRAALLVVPAGFLLAGWHRLHQAAGTRVVKRTSWADRDAKHYAWRIEAAVVGTLLTLAMVGAGAGTVVFALGGLERSGWTEVETEYAENCGDADCHRLVTDDGARVVISTPAKSWPADDALPGERVTVYAEADDLSAARSESPMELLARSAILLAVGVVVAAGAWTILGAAAAGPRKPWW